MKHSSFQNPVVRTLFRLAPLALVLATPLVVSQASCKAGAGDTAEGGGSAGGSGSSLASTPSDTTGTGFIAGVGGNTGVSCTDADCIGGGQQGGCDTGLSIGSANALDGAKAIGLCQAYQAGGWGVEQADWVRADGTPLGSDTSDELLGKGILTHFGDNVKPKEGAAMLVLSSGTARNPTDQGYADVGGFGKSGDGFSGLQSGYPAGFDPNSPDNPESKLGCEATGEPNDAAGLRLKIMTPADAKSISFNIDFYTFEFPNFVCSEFNDFFVTMMNPPPSDSVQGDISFDSKGALISVNAGFLTVCNSQVASNGVNFPCAAGPGDLSGTGFDQDSNSAATGWLETKAPITPSTEITLTFAIWDSGDGALDSTALVDNFKFEVTKTTTSTTPS